MSRVTKVKRQRSRHDRLWLGIFLIPNLSMYALFILVPSLAGVLLSFCKWRLIGPIEWVGFENYRSLLHDDYFLPALGRSALFILYGVIPTVFLGFLLAVLLNWKVKGISVFRTMFFVPITISSAVAGISWSSIMAPDSGVINSVLKKVGINGPQWLTDLTWALPSITIIVIWLSIPVVIILYLSGLQRIAPEILEAGVLDGAGNWRRIWSIIFPCVASTTQLVIILEVLAFLGSPFEVSLIMTQGGPLDSTTSLSYYAYKEAFERFRIGYSSAIVIVQFLIFLTVAGVIFLIHKFIKKRAN